MKAVRKRCVLRLDLKDVTDVENRFFFLLEQSSTHKVPNIEKTLHRRFSGGTERSLSEDDQRDLWGVYEERQCERLGATYHQSSGKPMSLVCIQCTV